MVPHSSTPRTPIQDQVFSNLGHHGVYLKTKKEMSLTWTNDEANGLSDPKCSEYYLINWLSSKERYMQWRDTPGSLIKHKVCREIADMLRGKGCCKQVDTMTIYNKIQHIEGKMRQCYEQYDGTKMGNGQKREPSNGL
jgi:hypothetical protein